MKKCLLLGAEGRLGRELSQCLSNEFELVALSHRTLDITDEMALTKIVFTFGPDLIVNAAAWTDVTGAEEHLKEVMAVNADAVGNLARVAKKANIPLLHYSTDYVFSGEGRLPWKTNDKVAPLGLYGRSKAEGERLMLKSGCRGAIVRLGWLHSGERDFVSAILKRALEGLPLSVVDNQWGTPTEAGALARWSVVYAAQVMMLRGCCIEHYVEKGGYISRFDLALVILRKARQEFLNRNDLSRASLCLNALKTMKKSTLNDGIRPKNCRLRNNVDHGLPETESWQKGVGNSVEKIISSF